MYALSRLHQTGHSEAAPGSYDWLAWRVAAGLTVTVLFSMSALVALGVAFFTAQ